MDYFCSVCAKINFVFDEEENYLNWKLNRSDNIHKRRQNLLLKCFIGPYTSTQWHIMGLKFRMTNKCELIKLILGQK